VKWDKYLEAGTAKTSCIDELCWSEELGGQQLNWTNSKSRVNLSGDINLGREDELIAS